MTPRVGVPLGIPVQISNKPQGTDLYWNPGVSTVPKPICPVERKQRKLTKKMKVRILSPASLAIRWIALSQPKEASNKKLITQAGFIVIHAKSGAMLCVRT